MWLGLPSSPTLCRSSGASLVFCGSSYKDFAPMELFSTKHATRTRFEKPPYFILVIRTATAGYAGSPVEPKVGPRSAQPNRTSGLRCAPIIVLVLH